MRRVEKKTGTGNKFLPAGAHAAYKHLIQIHAPLQSNHSNFSLARAQIVDRERIEKIDSLFTLVLFLLRRARRNTHRQITQVRVSVL